VLSDGLNDLTFSCGDRQVGQGGILFGTQGSGDLCVFFKAMANECTPSFKKVNFLRGKTKKILT
jgi:hypothetical protein